MQASGAGSVRAIDEWRGGSSAADPGWHDAGVTPRPRAQTPRANESAPANGSGDYVEGMTVRHEAYGIGKRELRVKRLLE